jgi:pimeloyl-ACP methyl ester carboxylesterase
MRWLKIVVALTIVLSVVYIFGPHPEKPIYSTVIPAVPSEPIALLNYVQQEESKHHVKKDNEAEIVWADSLNKHKTAYSIVYLHGFSASKMEGAPTHMEIAKKFGCNLYLARLSQHGIDTADALINMTADNLWESAKQAYAIGKQLGDKVILMGTSTGGTLAIQLAATYPDVAGLILFSPNIAVNDSNAWLINNPWGLQIARLVKGSDYNIIAADSVYSKYWNTKYRLEAVASLEELLETKMNVTTYQSIQQPVLTLYYYKDEQHQDPVVKVSATKEMFEKLGTAKELKRAIAMPNTGNHVLGSPILSKDVPGVEQETIRFMQEIMHMNAIK